MPVYDFRCDGCKWEGEELVPINTLIDCPKCGTKTEKVWRGRFNAAHDDTYVGGLTVENLGHNPVTFYSRTEHEAYLKEHGFERRVRHVGEQGSDKSKHTVRWTSAPTITEEERLANLREWERKHGLTKDTQ